VEERADGGSETEQTMQMQKVKGRRPLQTDWT